MEELILQEIYERVNAGETAAFAIITEEAGSSPRKSGAMMAVFQDGKIKGSVGGGKIEQSVIAKARECIQRKQDEAFEYTLSEDELGMACGGKVRGYIKVFKPQERLLIAGAGHIGKKLYQLAKIMGFHTIIFDDREDFANKGNFPLADEICLGDIGKNLCSYPFTEKDYIVIVTDTHSQDKAALKAVVNRRAAYIGMIGSTGKNRLVMKELIAEGESEALLRKVYAPIGIDMGSNLPEDIALGILSEIIMIKNGGTLQHMKDKKKVWD